MDLSAFKAYDIRGRVPDQLNEDMIERIGRAYVAVTGAKKIAVGYDIRLSSPALAAALRKGLTAAGADVYDIGLSGTEQIYFATFHYGLDGGIAVTASHNPKDYNGMKLVGKGSRPISSDNGLLEIKAQVAGDFTDAERPGTEQPLAIMDDYIQHLLGYINVAELKPYTVAINAGNGGAGIVIDALQPHLPFQFIKLLHEPDGHFPHGVPNPLLPENRELTAKALLDNKADFGIAWDGDFDRCFLFDHVGNFIPGEYVVGLLSEVCLCEEQGATIVHDPRVVWNTLDIVSKCGGHAVESKTGHAFVKSAMRENGAIYGGEMSAHHYFKDFFYCDSGMIPWLKIWELISKKNLSLSDLILERKACFPSSGEMNFIVVDPENCLEMVNRLFASEAVSINELDGLSMSFEAWRFNLRKSNTEPYVRLNVETRGDESLLREITQKFKKIMMSA